MTCPVILLCNRQHQPTENAPHFDDLCPQCLQQARADRANMTAETLITLYYQHNADPTWHPEWRYHFALSPDLTPNTITPVVRTVCHQRGWFRELLQDPDEIYHAYITESFNGPIIGEGHDPNDEQAWFQAINQAVRTFNPLTSLSSGVH